MRFTAIHALFLMLLSLPLAAQTAQQQTKPQDNLPDAPSACNHESAATGIPLDEEAPYVPLTRHEKAKRWAHYTYSPYTFSSVLLNAGWAQMMGDWPTYGGGMEGFGKRFGASLANTETGGFFKIYLLPTLFHQDPRYFRSRRNGVAPRVWYAATRVLVTRNDNGQATFNTSEVVGTAFTAALTNAYYPDRDRGFGNTMGRISGTIFADVGTNVLREFWPDIRLLFKKHAPNKVKKIQEKIPDQIEKAASPEPGE